MDWLDRYVSDDGGQGAGKQGRVFIRFQLFAIFLWHLFQSGVDIVQAAKLGEEVHRAFGSDAFHPGNIV